MTSPKFEPRRPQFKPYLRNIKLQFLSVLNSHPKSYIWVKFHTFSFSFQNTFHQLVLYVVWNACPNMHTFHNVVRYYEGAAYNGRENCRRLLLWLELHVSLIASKNNQSWFTDTKQHFRNWTLKITPCLLYFKRKFGQGSSEVIRVVKFMYSLLNLSLIHI